MIKSTNGQVPFSVILSQEILESADGKHIAQYVKAGSQVITPVLRLDPSLDKKWSGMTKNQQIKSLEKIFKAAVPTWNKRFEGKVGLKYVYAPPNTPTEVLTMLEQGNMRVVIPNASLDLAYTAQPETLKPQETTLVLYHNTSTTKHNKGINLNSIVINVYQKLVKSGFVFVNADGYYNNLPIAKSASTNEESKDMTKTTTNGGTEILVDPKMVEGVVKTIGNALEQVKKVDMAATLNPKDVKMPAEGTQVVTVANATTTNTPAETEVKKPTTTQNTSGATIGNNSTSPATTPSNSNNNNDNNKKAEDAKKPDAKVEKVTKDAEATEEGGISGTTIAIIAVVVVAVLALLGVAYKKMKN